MKTNALQRSKKYLTDEGWQVAIVEKFLQAFGNMKFPRRVDVWGFGDLLACRPNIYSEHSCPRCSGCGKERTGLGALIVCSRCCGRGHEHLSEQVIALVQCCPGASHAAHKAKILAIKERLVWKAAGGIILLHSWSKKGPRGKAKRWELREEIL